MNVVEVGDATDPRLADYRSLRHRPHLDGYFVVEGLFAVERLLASRHRVRSLFVARERLDRLPPTDATVFVGPLDLLRSVVGFDFHRGVIGAADRPEPLALGAVAAPGAARLAVVEDVSDFENLGLLFRSAAALRVDGVVLSPSCADPLSRRCVRVSMGHVLHVPFARADAWPAGVEDLADLGYEVVAMNPAPDAEPLRDAALDAVPRLALMVGTEGPGLSAGAVSRAHRRVRVEMAPGVDSLNVAVAASIAFHAAMPR